MFARQFYNFIVPLPQDVPILQHFKSVCDRVRTPCRNSALLLPPSKLCGDKHSSVPSGLEWRKHSSVPSGLEQSGDLTEKPVKSRIVG